MKKFKMKYGKKLLLSILVVMSLSLIVAISNVFAAGNKIYLSDNSSSRYVNIRYDISFTDEDIAIAQQINPNCNIVSWTLDTGYGRADSEALAYDSQGNTNNIERPISERQFIFSEQNGYDTLNSNGFDRVMLRIDFLGPDASCQINYPLVSNPILFSQFPYSF